MQYNLLSEPLIRAGRESYSLPALLAAMARGEHISLNAMRPHQRPALHMFLVQLGTLAMLAADLRNFPESAVAWRAALRCLTPQFPDDEPWHLVVEDRTRPAFMQPADPGGLKWSDLSTPDEMDMLITAKNHDMKAEIAVNAVPQDWLFALVSLQTMEGYGGRDNHGVVRMNGGSSSRPVLSLAPAREGSAEVDFSAWWARDTMRLLEKRHADGQGAVNGIGLVWLEPWPDGKSLNFDGLDLMFIEVCRRIRLKAPNGIIRAERSTSKAPRIAAKDLKGVVKDPWAPVNVEEGKALTLGGRDWSYRLLLDLLFRGKGWARPFLLEPSSEEKDRPMLIIAEAISRGNAKTEGFQSRVIPVPHAIIAEMFGEHAVAVADTVVKDIESVSLVLRNALALLAARGIDKDGEGNFVKPDKSSYSRAMPAQRAFEKLADRLFFDELWKRVTGRTDAELGAMRFGFLGELEKIARSEFDKASQCIPCPSLMRPRAQAKAQKSLDTGLATLLRKFRPTEEANG
ncbi:MAG: type I-E CRISPR-associated protein Cse1/CasA [Rhizobiaceae bacterium]|nr:type I-E CRISPR-associated protein Cse1/CasA [Rhizobiaceae bacterium]